MSTIDIRISRARSVLIMQHAFFGALSMNLRPVERSDISTLATDSKFLFYSRQWLDKMSEPLILFGVAHEVMHCALGHCFRRGNRDPELWNIACDHVVNLLLKAAGFTVPDWAYCDPQYAKLNAEQIYRILQQKQQEEHQLFADAGSLEDGDEADEASDGDSEDGGNGGDSEGDGEDGDGADSDGGSGTGEDGEASNGSGSGQSEGGELSEQYAEAHGDPGGCGEVLDAAPAHDKAALEEAADEWAVKTRQAVNIARRQGEGKLPGFIEEIIGELNSPKTDWRDVLRRFVDPSTTKDFSWANPNKRFMPMGYFTPGVVTDGVNHVGIIIDTSQSVHLEWLKRFGGEAQSALDDGAVDKLTVLYVDTQINRIAEYSKGETVDFTVVGRGGTDFRPGFAWLNDNAPDLSAAIYFTDLECSDFGETPTYPVLWAVHGYDARVTKQYMERVPFGECLELVQ